MDWFRKIEERANANRAWALFGTALFLVCLAAVIFWINPTLFKDLFYPNLDTVAQVRAWSARTYAAVLIAGLPIAFLIWHWRDRNMRDQISNARKDTNLKEFQEVQLRAAGGLDEKLPAEAREQLQIAALHQLRGFLRGDYGKDFKRPAFELLLAGHAAAIHRIGVPAVQAQINEQPLKFEQSDIAAAVQELLVKLSPIDLARMSIIEDEAEHVFNKTYPLAGRRFDLLDMRDHHFPNELDLSDSNFFGIIMLRASLKGAILDGAHLEGASMFMANLEGANLRKSHLEALDIVGANLKNVNLFEACLVNAKLARANLEGACLLDARIYNTFFSEANFKGADLETFSEGSKAYWRDAFYDAATKFEEDWATMSDEEKATARQPWRDLGMRHVDEIEPE